MRNRGASNKATCEHWIENWPELGTRPALVEYLKTDPAMRGYFFKAAQRIVELSHRLRGCGAGIEAVVLYYRRYRVGLCRIEKRIPDNTTRAELQGAFRNIWLNCQRIVGHGQPHYRLLDVEHVRENWGSIRTKLRLEEKLDSAEKRLAEAEATALEEAAKLADDEAREHEGEARIWEEAAKFVSLHGLSPGTRGMCVELAKAMNEKAAALRARGGKQ